MHWSDYGGRIKQIRATAERFPYVDLTRNKDYDVASAGQGMWRGHRPDGRQTVRVAGAVAQTSPV